MPADIDPLKETALCAVLESDRVRSMPATLDLTKKGDATAGAPPSPPGSALVATLHYFHLSDACVVCKAPPTVVRVATTVQGTTMATPMCDRCGNEEIAGLLERKEMAESPDQTYLIHAGVADALSSIPRERSAEAAQAQTVAGQTS